MRIADCRLRALEADALSRRPLYLAAFHAGLGSRYVRLLNNNIYGSAGWGIGGVGQAVRTEIIENTFHGGAVSDVVTISGSFTDSLIDANILTDTPGRMSLWLDCIANQVEMHRDDHSKGIDLWGEDAIEIDKHLAALDYLSGKPLLQEPTNP